MGVETGDLSFSFVKLQRIRGGFERVARRQPVEGERALRRLARELGATVVPLLLRYLVSPDERAGDWAVTLLESVCELEDRRPRVARDVRALLARPDVGDRARVRCMRLLHAIDAELPDVCEVDDLGALRDHSLRELASCLDSAAEIARAADLLVTQLEDEDLLDFVDDFADGEPARAAALLDELLVRANLDEVMRAELRRVRAPLPAPAALAAEPTDRPEIHCGRHPDGREVVVVVARRPRSRPARYRVLVAIVCPRGVLREAHYRPESTGGAVERDVLPGLREQGFRLRRATLRLAVSRVSRGARAAVAEGHDLPRDYYLARDLLGLRAEHFGLRRAHAEGGDLYALLDRAMDLLSAGDARRARPLLEQYTHRCDDDAEGHANLGVCLMALGELPAARAAFERAGALDPGDAVHRWNLASVAHRSDEPGGCYLALCAYLARDDRGPDADDRAAAATEYVAEYERLARVEHGAAVDAASVARAEASCAEARRLLDGGLLDEAIAGFERALQVIPGSGRAWRELGAAYLRRNRRPDARRCLQRAAALLPGDAETEQLLLRAE